ncbi:hypothetical protein E4U30_007883 [Claviceps sp. LM220 group G6]|nr:hypothetical protein E4U15_007527 [Claviceps sp. LM218 group G6]KAG6090844.1 hypothetical protein E4U30_007883 [Claviceps sp. LM220 group G6]KAG6093645.1 hypothetical protein E4U31_006693 [Claviceps sp. LM219 group G6]
MSDRRRINGPSASTQIPFYYEDDSDTHLRKRDQGLSRPVYLKTGVTPSASGSAYLEVGACRSSGDFGMKLICTVHGPRSLPRSAPFSPHIVISTHVKYAPFATRKRRGYARDTGERDLSVHLETALRGAIIAHRWPKSGVDVIVTVIEGETDRRTTNTDCIDEWNTMAVLSGCITAASAAVADAGIDCVGTVTGGVAALVLAKGHKVEPSIVIDPVLSDDDLVMAACCVAYLAGRDEVTNLWYRGTSQSVELKTRKTLMARAIMASKGISDILSLSLVESLASQNHLKTATAAMY